MPEGGFHKRGRPAIWRAEQPTVKATRRPSATAILPPPPPQGVSGNEVGGGRGLSGTGVSPVHERASGPLVSDPMGETPMPIDPPTSLPVTSFRPTDTAHSSPGPAIVASSSIRRIFCGFGISDNPSTTEALGSLANGYSGHADDALARTASSIPTTVIVRSPPFSTVISFQPSRTSETGNLTS